MPKHSLQSKNKTVQSFIPASRNAEVTLYNGAAAGASTGIDTLGFREAIVVFNVGAVAAGGSLAVTVWSSATDDSSDSPTQLTGATMAIADTEDSNVFIGKVDCKNLAGRYLWVRTVQTGAVAVDYSVVVELGNALVEPVTQANTIEFAV